MIFIFAYCLYLLFKKTLPWFENIMKRILTTSVHQFDERIIATISTTLCSARACSYY